MRNTERYGGSYWCVKLADEAAECLKRAEAAGEPFGYRIRLHGVVVGGAADAREIVHRKTGEVIFRTTAASMESLAPVIAEMGLDPQELDLREPADLWRVPRGGTYPGR